MWPVAMHPKNKNELLAWDLAQDPTELAHLNAADLRLRLFTKAADLPEGVTRLPLKSIHLNRSPMVMGNLRVVSEAMAQHWGVDMTAQLENAAKARDLPDMSGIWPEVYARSAAPVLDVDEDLYGGFVDGRDRRRLNEIRALTPEQMAHQRLTFDDVRLGELVFRYRARNFPDTLSPAEAEQWEAHRAERLLRGLNGARTAAQLLEEIDQLSEDADARGEAILDALVDYTEAIVPADD